MNSCFVGYIAFELDTFLKLKNYDTYFNESCTLEFFRYSFQKHIVHHVKNMNYY